MNRHVYCSLVSSPIAEDLIKCGKMLFRPLWYGGRNTQMNGRTKTAPCGTVGGVSGCTTVPRPHPVYGGRYVQIHCRAKTARLLLR